MWFLVWNYYSETYVPFWLAEFFHSWPHLSYKGLERKDNTFDPESQVYIETLLFWGGIPVVFLASCIVGLLLFACCLCMRRNKVPTGPRPKIARLKWALIFVTLICMAAIGISFYANSTAATGIHHFANAVTEANGTIGEIEHTSDSMLVDFEKVTNPVGVIPSLKRVYHQSVSNGTVLNVLISYTNKVRSAATFANTNISTIYNELSGAYSTSLTNLAEEVDYYYLYGWAILLGILVIYLLVCLLVLCCAGRSSRGGLVVCCICLILAFTVVWFTVAGEMFVTMGLSDLCVEPKRYLDRKASEETDIPQEILDYYLICDPDIHPSPFDQVLSNTNKVLIGADDDLQKLTDLTMQFVRQPEQLAEAEGYISDLQSIFDRSSKNLQTLTVDVNCKDINRDYLSALFGLCYNVLAGLGLHVACGVVLGLLWVIAIIQSTVLASRLSRRKIRYEPEQDDPFLPPRDGQATLEGYRRRQMDQPSTSGLGRRLHSSSVNSHIFEGQPSSRVSSMMTPPTLHDDLPPSYTLAISRDRPTAAPRTTENRYSSGSLV